MKTMRALTAAGVLALTSACAGGTTVAASSSDSPEARVAATGTTIVARSSRFGRMLWGPKRHAIYIFQRDGRNRSNCYGACAKAWPPVHTRGKPVAGPGIRRSLLGTTRRRGGRFQVTYAGKPLYYYAHEGPGQVLCHNVNLNGGLWWVVGPDGKRRP
jgi:predicted lipoprotein with Yx(FWY)xxD motif